MPSKSRRSFIKDAATSILSEKEKIPVVEFIDPSNKTIPRHLAKTSTGISEYTGTFTDAHILHLLRRTMFGVTPEDLAFFKTKSMQEAVNYLLVVPTTPPAPPVNNYSSAQITDPDVPLGQTWVNAPANPQIEFLRRNSFKSWWTGLMLNQERNIREKMTLFWHNHFATESNVIQDSRYLYKHHALLRASCLGNFKTFVREITIDPGMLVYLNGELNIKNAPDENYARELQELFTVGKNLTPHYTEADVKAAARVLTGWKTNRVGISSTFNASLHDTGNKQFSSFYNNTLITGRSGATAGNLELDDLLNMIFAHQEVAKSICREIYRYFIYYIIDENVELNVIEPLATYFRNNNYDIKKLMEKLLKSEHFFDPLNMGCLIKQPMDQLIGSSRLMGLTFPSATNTQQQYGHWQFIQQFGILTGQDLCDPPNVAGWPAFHQDPQYYELWINSDSLPKRNLFNDLMIYVGFNQFGFNLKYNVIAFAERLSDPSNPNTLINDITKLGYPVDISTTSKNAIKTSILLSGQTSDHYWTDAWNTYKNNPSDPIAKNDVEIRLQALLKHFFGLAEYQLS